MDDEEWEELDESAMEECMVLATQLYTQPPQQRPPAQGHTNIRYEARPNNLAANPETNHCPNNSFIANNPNNRGSIETAGESTVTNCVVDSGVWSTRSSAVNASTRTYSNFKAYGTYQANTKAKHSYSNRFSDFSMTKNVMGRGSVRGKVNLSQSKVYGSLTMSGPGTPSRLAPSEPSTAHPNVNLPISPTSDSDSLQQQQLAKVEQERATFDEKVLMMQGEISLLRVELKRKETALEGERLDRCAAIDAAEKRGKEKVAKMVSEVEAKSKENVMLVDKLQGELHFKKREIGELLNRCQQLELHCGQEVGQQGRAAGNKLGRAEMGSPKSSPSSSHTKFISRFDFGSGAAKVSNVEVQTDSPILQINKRKKLPVALSRGRGCGVRRMALLLSSLSAPATTIQPLENTGWELPSEWSHIVSQTLAESEDGRAWRHLVKVASERLQKVYSTITSTPAEAVRCGEMCGDIQTWYERSVVGALEVVSVGVESTNAAQVLPSLTSHLKPLYIKEQVVNSRICLKILHAAEKVVEAVSHPVKESLCNDMVMMLRNCCENIASSSEVTALLRILAALGHHSTLTSHLCSSSGNCVVGLVCSKVRSVSDTSGGMTLVLLAWVMSVMSQPPPWLTSSCSCPTLLLAALISHLYQHMLTIHKGTDLKSKEMRRLVVVMVRVLRTWSVVDPGWWERVAPLPQYPALMALIPSATANTTLDKHTVDQLYDLYEFDEGSFEV